MNAQREAFCNREYNNRAMIPEFAQILARWQTRAQQTRTQHSDMRTLRYGAHEREQLDLFPAGIADAPLLVFIHGGYWRSLSKDDFSWVAPPFTAQGVSVAVLNYALAPAVDLQTITRQILRALAFVRGQAGELGIDPDRIFVSGHSAGGHLSAMALAARCPQWQPGLPANLIKGAVAVSGLYELEPLRHASFLNPDLRLTAKSARLLSPAFMPPATAAPLITAVGGLESGEFKRQNALIGERWARVLRSDVPMPGHHHLSVIEQLAEPKAALFREALALCTGR